MAAAHHKARAGRRLLSTAASLLAVSTLVIQLSGCALEAAPSPPSLKIPQQVNDLAATRAGDSVTLHWTMPTHTTDKALLKGLQPVTVCRATAPVAQDTPCQAAAHLHFLPGKAVVWTDALPPQFLAGTPRLLYYSVEFYSPWQKTAGPSNSAVVVAGPPPPPVGPITLTARKDGIVMHWQAASPAPDMVMRIRRTLVLPPKTAETIRPKPQGNPMSGEGPAPEQVLEISLSQYDPGQAIDRDAALDHTYTYTLQRVFAVKIDGSSAELPGAPSQSLTINAKNVFPPAAPGDLQAVADPEAGAIDLSWAPSADSDVIGYVVYRRVANSGAAWQAISPTKPLLAAPAWHDVRVQSGVTYEYAVAAVSRNGQISPRSARAQETLPGQ